MTKPSLIERPRLVAKLNEGLDSKLTLLSAQAGYGKSTVLSQWTGQCGCPVAWLSLDRQDNDWGSFWRCVTAAVRVVSPGFGLSLETLLDQGPASSAQSPEPAIGLMLNELADLPDTFAIVLDDYHFIESQAIHGSLRFFIDYLPPNVHLYIASRNVLPFSTTRLRANAEMRELIMADFRFERFEAAAYFGRRLTAAMADEQIQELHAQTEGWIGGMQLAAIALERSKDIANSIRGFKGKTKPVADYFLEEVLRELPESLLDFLLDTSVLSAMNRSLCEAVTGQADSDRQLALLERLNLFLIPLDEEREWYRYHHLLSDYLRHALSELDHARSERAHAGAAAWLEACGMIAEAGEHYMAARRYGDVVRLVEAHLPLLIQKSFADLSRWLLLLPEASMDGKPMAEMFYCFLLVGSGQWEKALVKIDEIRNRYERLQGTLPEDSWHVLMGNVYFLSATAAFLRKDLDGVTRFFELSDRYGGSRFRTVSTNNHKGFEEFDDQLAYINDHHGADEFLQLWIGRWGGDTPHPFVVSLYTTRSKLLYEWNRLEEAEACAVRWMESGRLPSTARSLVHLFISASRIRQAAGSPSRAVSLLEEAKQLIVSPDYDRYAFMLDAEAARLALRQGRAADALAWLERHPFLARDGELSIDTVQEHLAASAILAACGRCMEALALTEALNRLLLREDRLRDRIKVLIVRSLAYDGAGHREQALDVLEEALRLAEPQGFVRSFADEGAPMAKLLQAFSDARGHAEHGEASSLSGYARRLLQDGKPSLAAPTSLPLAPGIQADESSEPRIKVHCFGRFRAMKPDGFEFKWRTSKTEELLAFLVHQRGEAVDRFRIMDALWNDDSEKTSSYFNTTAHYLRKTMSSVGIRDVLEHNRGYYRLRTDAFVSELNVFEQEPEAGEVVQEGNIQAYEQAIALYTGGYMEDNDYGWAELRRSALENRYLELIIELNGYYMDGQSHSSAIKLLKKAIKHVPWSEAVHAALIRAHLAGRDRLSALKQYDALKRMLRREYREEPGEEIRKLLHLSH
jgi:LuxR family maltose regulon positive regulatory protein